MATIGEYKDLADDQVPDHEYQKTYLDGYPRGVCNACGPARESRFHKIPETLPASVD